MFLLGTLQTIDKTGNSTSVQYGIGNIIMDGDTTTISHIHNDVDENIGVWSDVGHAKKSLYGHLIKVGEHHKLLSKSVAEYLTKCFGYLLTQNKGNPDKIAKGCTSIPKHAFGDHSSCGSWCTYNTDPSKYCHKSLPHGKDLHGDELKIELVKVQLINDF